MLNSVNVNAENDLIIQKNRIQKNNIAYRGKATNSLESSPVSDEFQKKGLGKGAKFALGTLGLAGIAIAIDRIFLKGKYTDDILKRLKNNVDDVTKGANEGTDDFGRIVDDEIDLTGISTEDLKSLDDMDFEKLVDDVDLEKLADEAERVLGDPSAIKKADIIFDGVSKPIEKTAKETAEEVQVITPNKNEIVENIEDEVAKTKKLIEDAGYQVAEVKPIDDAEGVIKRAIKELDDEAEKATKKRKEEAERLLEQQNMDMAAVAILADDALRQGKNKIDDVVQGVKDKADDVLEDLTAGVRNNSDDVMSGLKQNEVLDNVAENAFGTTPKIVDDVAESAFEPSAGISDWRNPNGFDMPQGVPELYNPSEINPINVVDDLYNPTDFNPMDGIDDFLKPHDLTGGGFGDTFGGFMDDFTDIF